MTDADPTVGPPETPEATPEEELAAAILDGEASPEEQARAGEPAVAAALAAQRRVADALAVAPAVDEVGRERSIAAALAAWGTEATTEATTGAGPARAGDDLARRRAGRTARLLPALGAAAAVVVALVLGGIALGGGGDDADQTAVGDAFDATDEDLAAGGAAADATASAPVPSVALGAFDDLDALVAEAGRTAAQSRAVGGAGGSGSGSGSDGAGSADAEEAAEGAEAGTTSPAAATGAPAAGDDAGEGSSSQALDERACVADAAPEGTFVASATATLDGRPVAITVVDTADGTVVQVVDVATCEVVYEGPPG